MTKTKKKVSTRIGQASKATAKQHASANQKAATTARLVGAAARLIEIEATAAMARAQLLLGRNERCALLTASLFEVVREFEAEVKKETAPTTDLAVAR